MNNKTFEYIVHYRYCTRTGIETWAHVSAYLQCKGDTTIREIMEWVDKKDVTQPIRIEISKTG